MTLVMSSTRQFSLSATRFRISLRGILPLWKSL